MSLKATILILITNHQMTIIFYYYLEIYLLRSRFHISVSLQFNILNKYEQQHIISNVFHNFENIFCVKHTEKILHYFFINFEIKLRLNSLQFLRDHSAYLLCDFSETTLTNSKSKRVILSRINKKDTGNISTRFGSSALSIYSGKTFNQLSCTWFWYLYCWL